MSFLFKNDVRTAILDSTVESIFSGRSNFYYFIGKILPWNDPFNPDQPLDTQSYEYDTRNKIILVKKININDVSFVIPRINWTSGTVYDQFDGDYSTNNPAASGATSLQRSRFYVLSSSFNVYKCLFNNNGVPSTDEPSGTDLTTITTNDGYVWKYLYTIPLSSRNKFFTESLIPVQTTVTNAFYSNGEVDKIIIENKGSGYLGNSEVSLQVNGSFKSNVGNVTALLTPVFTIGGSIENVIIRNSGNNYSSANIQINDNTGTGSSLYKNLININLTDPGSGFFSNVQANTTVSITTVGDQPVVPANVSLLFGANSVVGFVIEESGNGYTPAIAANTSIVITTTGNAQPTSNASATLTFATTARLTPVLLNGVVDRVIIEDPGVGYSSNIQTTISAIGDGSNVELLPFINESGELEDVIIISRGEGYSFLDLEVFGGGSNAQISADLSTGDLDTNQALVELSAADGAIHAIRIESPGSGYSNATISIVGDGNGFSGTVDVSNSGSISKVVVSNPGIGYSFANVIISGDGSGANATAIFSPQGGHGSNAIKELFANTLIFYTTINNEKVHGINIANDFRQVGILKDIKQFNSEKTFANSIGTPTFLATFNTLNNSLSRPIEKDTVLELANVSYRKFEVVDTLIANSQIVLKDINNSNLGVGNVLYEPITNSNFTVVSVDQQPTINKFSGDLLFIDNATQVSFSDQQLVTIRTILKL